MEFSSKILTSLIKGLRSVRRTSSVRRHELRTNLPSTSFAKRSRAKAHLFRVCSCGIFFENSYVAHLRSTCLLPVHHGQQRTSHSMPSLTSVGASRLTSTSLAFASKILPLNTSKVRWKLRSLNFALENLEKSTFGLVFSLILSYKYST